MSNYEPDYIPVENPYAALRDIEKRKNVPVKFSFYESMSLRDEDYARYLDRTTSLTDWIQKTLEPWLLKWNLEILEHQDYCNDTARILHFEVTTQCTGEASLDIPELLWPYIVELPVN